MKKTNTLLGIVVLLLFAGTTKAQNDSVPLFNTLRLEVRADADYHHSMSYIPDITSQPLHHNGNTYGFKGKYFNLHMGGNLTPKISYYFRQRIIANPGSVTFFDNTDFLFLNFKLNKNWSIRLGKDALAVGGYEYDAPPIDVMLPAYYWDWFYCFQLAASAAYTTNDGKHTLRLQVANSPYLNSSAAIQNSLFSYNLLWMGDFGHFQTLYSFSMFQRDKDQHYMAYTALGNKLVFDKWDLYVDLMHHAVNTSDFFKNFAVVARANVYLNKNFNLFAKVSYEQNLNNDEMIYHLFNDGNILDCLAMPGQTYMLGGLGFELRPKACTDVRFHGFVAGVNCQQTIPSIAETDPITVDFSHKKNNIDLMANVGVSWNINFLKYINKKIK